ncbi:Bug family tripartite tricarboxylate transporter substrate binding protein [Quisquiliibacterium transsilvanicum]|uniref:Tripartite-type tricarboxylate transporter receptor subunit TctC n=1 Tax=Quisquiliibacterium transsilvanicum TaxID=1549638 RepID=A0A7W8HLZ9_9BURK|nr:tripartite tricarboxylate transporter substrate binding protein [Quisquiliibacterium transsilvanicum]MBB5273525.1 tripartite-type tricarboxylate transporter receptor subunit TctC [Quisquiliibacterium transsilvanicum]
MSNPPVFNATRRLVLAGTIAAAAPAWAQAPAFQPKRPVRVVVPFPAGGATDLTARLIAAKLMDMWGQPVAVDNRPGASGMIGAQEVLRAPADGHTIMVSITTHIQNPSLFAKMPYEPMRDFAAVSQSVLSYLALAVRPDFPANTLAEFVAHVKAKPGAYTFGSFGAASSSHIVGESFGRQIGAEVIHVAYKGSAPMLADLLGGQVPLGWADVSTAIPHIRAGKLKALAVSGSKRTPMLPDVPTLGESGYPGYEPLGWAGVFVHGATPKPMVEAIARDVIRATRHPDNLAKFAEQTLVPVASTPDEFTRQLREDAETWAKMIKAAGISPQ